MLLNMIKKMIYLQCMICMSEHGNLNQKSFKWTGTCRNDTVDNFIKKCRNIHGDKYNYDDVVYVNNLTKAKVNCLFYGIESIEYAASGHVFAKNEKLSLIKQRMY